MSLIVSAFDGEIAEELRNGRFKKVLEAIETDENSKLSRENRMAIAEILRRNMGRGIKSRRGRVAANPHLPEYIHTDFVESRDKGSRYEAALEVVGEKYCLSPKAVERYLTSYKKEEAALCELAWEVNQEYYKFKD